MSRVSDTRLRTRQAASNLVAAGRRPHEVTVDLVYAEIRQGSRTTINDELKLWKDEQAKVDALSAALPAPVANAMLAAWATAVEHGERVFDDRRAEVEAELAQAVARGDSAEAALAGTQAETATLRAQLEAARTDVSAAREEARGERDGKEVVLQRLREVEQRVASDQVDAARRLNALRDTYEQRLQELRDVWATAEAGFREEITRATERLEGVQKHVMLQVSQAREAQKRAEEQAAKSLQRSERLAGELEPLRTELATVTTQLQRAAQDHAAELAKTQHLLAERDELKVQLANTMGRLESAMQLVGESTVRAGAAAPHGPSTVPAKPRHGRSVARKARE